MNEITFLGEDTIIVKIDKLEQMMTKVLKQQMEYFELRFAEMIEAHDRLIPKNEVLSMLNISKSCYDNWIRSGTLIGHKIGDKPYVFLSNVRNAAKRVN